MENKNKDIVLVVILVAFVGLIGYLMGSSSGDNADYYEEEATYDLSTGNSSAEQEGSSSDVSQSQSSQQLDLTETLNGILNRLKENPNDGDILARAADLYFSMRQFDVALNYYTRAVKANPQDVDSYNDMGLASFYMGDTPGALANLDKGIKIAPSYQRIWLTKGFIHIMGEGDKKKGMDAWGKAVAIDPKSQIGIAAQEYLTKYENETVEGNEN